MMEKRKRNNSVFGQSHAFGGKFIVSNPFDSKYYDHPNYFDLVEKGIQVSTLEANEKKK